MGFSPTPQTPPPPTEAVAEPRARRGRDSGSERVETACHPARKPARAARVERAPRVQVVRGLQHRQKGASRLYRRRGRARARLAQQDDEVSSVEMIGGPAGPRAVGTADGEDYRGGDRAGRGSRPKACRRSPAGERRERRRRGPAMSASWTCGGLVEQRRARRRRGRRSGFTACVTTHAARATSVPSRTRSIATIARRGRPRHRGCDGGCAPVGTARAARPGPGREGPRPDQADARPAPPPL